MNVIPGTKEFATKALEKMYLIRLFEERVVELFKRGMIRGATHVYLGEEAVATGACLAINEDDYITSTHRGHGHCIAKGADVRKMMAEILGRRTGYCRGYGGSMHIADIEIGILGANGIVGGGIPIATGAGLTCKYKNNKKVVLCFFGDGATNQGSFHEALNLASVWKLPVIYICENNGFAVTTPTSISTSVKDIFVRAQSYSMKGTTIDGNDVLEVYKAVKDSVERARSGEGPTLIEAKTYRWEGHYLGDPQVYRTKEEVEEWKKKDPIERFKKYAKENNLLTDKEIEEILTRAKLLVDDAEKFALESEHPSPEELKSLEILFAKNEELEKIETYSFFEKGAFSGDKREITYAEAINEALEEEMARDTNVILLGEDIGFHGGAFQVTKGLYKKFGKERVRDTPVSEAAIVGAAIGAALTGLRPVAEIMYIDFTTIAMDQIINQAAKIRFMFGGKPKLPLVIRTMCGAGTGSAAQHSQNLEALFYHIPGLKIAIPSTPFDAKGLLKTAIRDDNPVIFIEYKRLYHTLKGPVPRDEYLIPFGKADIKKEGKDVTVVATSAMVHEALKAAEILEREGVSIEIIDPRTLYPLDKETIISSVKKTGKLVIVHEAIVRGGIGGDIAAMVLEEAFDYLDAPIKRIGGLEVPMPYAKNLEEAVIPNCEKIIAAVKEIL
jgi:pyruvate dehydrogenase E1 component alpha subunit